MAARDLRIPLGRVHDDAGDEVLRGIGVVAEFDEDVARARATPEPLLPGLLVLGAELVAHVAVE